MKSGLILWKRSVCIHLICYTVAKVCHQKRKTQWVNAPLTCRNLQFLVGPNLFQVPDYGLHTWVALRELTQQRIQGANKKKKRLTESAELVKKTGKEKSWLTSEGQTEQQQYYSEISPHLLPRFLLNLDVLHHAVAPVSSKKRRRSSMPNRTLSFGRNSSPHILKSLQMQNHRLHFPLVPTIPEGCL